MGELEMKECKNCGKELSKGQIFCPECGMENDETIKVQIVPHNKKRIIAVAVAVILITVVAAISIRGKQVESVRLNKTEFTLKVGDEIQLKHTISPDDAKNKEVTWTTSNSEVVNVSDGLAAALEEGSCLVTVITKNNKTAICEILVDPAGPDFDSIASDLGYPDYLDLAEDGSYMSLDTNPVDKDDYTDYDAILAIEEINNVLDLPESVYKKMMSTRSLDGRIQEDHGDIRVSWIYHPNKGMEIMYEAK